MPKEQKPLVVKKATESESDDRAMARSVLRPSVNHAVTLANVLRRDHGELQIADLVDELSAQCAAVSEGSISQPEALLTAQAQTLDALFNDLVRLAYRNISNNFDVAERLMRLAFRAQTQGRATVETLGNLRNPPMVIARQANIAHGPQQVNNGEMPRARETQIQQNRLLELTDGERLDTGTTGAAGSTDPALATVGTIDRTKEPRG